MNIGAWTARSLRLIPCAMAVVLAASAARAQDAASPATATPAAPASKLTVAYYRFSSGTRGVDVNLRHTFPLSTAWLGVYHEDDGFDQVRVGYEFDYHRDWLTLVPSVQAASHGFLGASVYAEGGRAFYAIGGGGRTNLEPYWNLGFDPNDYVQLGGGHRDAAGNTESVFAIHDVRLGTGQTNTHIVVRRYLPREWRLTFDVVRERGEGDGGVRVRGWSTSADVDWRRWFVRVAEDPHVNYTADRQIRLAGGVRF